MRVRRRINHATAGADKPHTLARPYREDQARHMGRIGWRVTAHADHFEGMPAGGQRIGNDTSGDQLC
jgi:hypothetical protein